jgi:ubiquinone/menaquinone biosynthesis C-methylase UbiE
VANLFSSSAEPLMFTRLLHWIVARPFVYDLVQKAVGADAVRKRVAAQAAKLHDAKLVLDIGGGTGAVSAMWPASTKYICLDIDLVKLRGFLDRNPNGIALQADAACLPIADGSVEVVLCNSVTHHLTDDLLNKMIAEVGRILSPTGKFILTDAVWAEDRRIGKLMWKYDRGSFPRTTEKLQAVVQSHLAIESWEPFAVWHEYFVCIARKASG